MMAVRMGSSGAKAVQVKGVGHVWPGFLAGCVAFATAAGHGALVVTGWPLVACLVCVAVFAPLSFVFAYLLYAWHTERWPYKPPPMAPPELIDLNRP